MRLDVVRRLKPPASSTSFLLRAAWKYGLGVGIAAVVLTAGGVDRVQPNGHPLASNVLPTTVPCGQIATDVGDPHTATWTALKSPYPGTASPYNLPVSTLNNADPTVQPCDAIVVPPDVTLKIDASQGPVQIFSHGAAIKVDGGHLLVLGKDEVNSVLFEAEPDVASWTGITIDASDASHRGNASFAYASIQHALNSIAITGGATSTPDPINPAAQLPYGLALVNSGVGPSVFDGIDAADTPVSLKGRTDPQTQRADGKFGTVNNIGSQGIKFSWSVSAPAPTGYALDVESITFGSSVPFATTGCLPLQLPCSAGFIGNDAILATFTTPNAPPVLISQSRIYRAGSFGVELTAANRPVIKDNNFDCNGTSSATPTQSCVGTGLKYSAIYLKDATVDLENSVTNNVGHEDGLDAIVLNGTIVYAPSVSQQVTWKNATNDPKNDHLLGYLLSGDLNINSGTLVVPAGSVVKSKGTINLTGAALNASDTSKPDTKVFTSLRDNVNIASCPSVFVQSCPSPLPAGEWGGINLVGSRTDATMRAATQGTITNAAILYATTGVHILNGNSLTISGSTIGPTFADGVLAEGTPLAVTGTTFVPTSGNHGILADFRNSGPPGAGLKVGGNTFQGSVNEAIRAVGLGGQPVDIENNSIRNAGAVGSAGSAAIYLQGADNLTLQRNDVAMSGTGNVAYPAIWLDGVSHADFSGPISGNTGSGNGLNAIAFHGDTKTLAWQTVAPNGPLGFIVDGNLLVVGDLTLVNGDYAPVLAGTITVQTGKLTSSGAVLTSLKEQTANLLSCGSVFVPRISGVCSLQGPGDWGGLVLDPGMANQLTDSEIRYAVTGISVGVPTGQRMAQNLTMTRTNIRNTSSDGLSTQSPVSITGGAFTNNGGHGIKIDLTNTTPSAFQPVTITGHASVAGSGQDGILAIKLGGHTVQVQDVSVDRSGTYGINLRDADHLTLTNNTVTNSGATFPAIYLNGFTGLFANISGNRGALNGVDAIAFHGTITDDLTWQTARKSADPTRLLGYIVDGTLTMLSGHTLTVNGGDIVKVGNGGLLNLQGVNLKADDTGVGSQKVFTSLTDDSVGVAACHSAVVTACPSAPNAGDWGGIVLAGSGANGTLVNAVVRYASTGILITSGATSTTASSVFGLVVSGSSIGPTAVDGINATKTAISVTTSAVIGGTHGISVDLTAAVSGTPLRLSGNRFMSTSAEAILGQALGGQPVWITDNRIQGATTFGIRLLNADQLVLRNNNVAGSGGGPGAGAGRYPAIYLPAVSADFVGNIRGNVGSGNGLDALVFDGKVTRDLTWITPSNAPSTHALGYLLDGGVTFQGGTLFAGPGDVVKSLGGPITINGGRLTVTGAATGGSPTSRSAIFTSLKDNPVGPASPVDVSDAAAVSCPSVLVAVCGPGPGDWGGLAITANAAGVKGSGVITYGLINYANTGISLDSGPISASPESSNFRLTVVSTTIINASKDGINSLDTPFSVKDSSTIPNVVKDPSKIQNVGGNGIIASFFSPANCPSTLATVSPCVRLNITNTQIVGTGKDGIVANGLGGQPTTISNNTVANAGTYGIRLIGADQLTLTNNTVNTSGLATNAYPAIYLNNVSGDFNTAIAGNMGAGNGLNALVFHGTVTTNFTWLTPDPSGVNPLGYMLDGGLTVNGTWLSNVGTVKVLTGAIKIAGALTSNGTTYTSMKENLAPFACNTVFVPAACPQPPQPSDYWGGLMLGGTSNFTGGEIRFASTGLVASAALNLSGVSIHDIAGTAVDTTGGTLALDCSSIRANGTGVSAGASATITQSDVFGNTTYDLIAPAGASATYDWWGLGGGKFGTTPVSVVQNKLTSQAPVATLTLSDDVMTATNAFAIGNMKVVVDFSRKMTTDPATPVVQFAHLGDPPPPHALTGTWPTSQKWTSNLYPLNSGTATLGKNTLNVAGARSCVPDPTTNLMTPASQDFTAAITPTSLAVPASSATYGGTTSLSATLSSGIAGLANGKVEFALNGTSAGSQNSNNAGVAGVSGVSVAGINAGSHPNYVSATYRGDDVYSPSSATGDLNVAAAPLTITADPKSRVYGAANPTFTVVYSGFVNGETSAVLGGTLTFAAPALSSPVGTYAGHIVPSGQTSTNYAITYVNGTLTVTPAPLTITADGNTKLYGAALPALTATPTGLVSPDTLASIGVTPVLATTATSSSAVGTYPITASGPAATANYSINYVGGTLQVNPAPTTVAGSALPEPSNLGATVTLSATVTSMGINPNNEGTVTFSEGATTFCTTPVLTGNGGSCTYNAFTTGTHTITATYNPSANFLTSSSTFPHTGN